MSALVCELGLQATRCNKLRGEARGGAHDQLRHQAQGWAQSADVHVLDGCHEAAHRVAVEQLHRQQVLHML